MRRRRNCDYRPYELTARFESTCPETGLTIRKGENCVYFPEDRKAYHVDSKTAAEWRSQQEADASCLGDANW